MLTCKQSMTKQFVETWHTFYLTCYFHCAMILSVKSSIDWVMKSLLSELVTRVFLTGMCWQQGSENKDMVMSAEKWICFGVRASYDILMIYFYIWIMCQIIHNKSRSICELWLYVAFQGISWMLMWQNQAHIFGRSTSSGSNIPAVMYWLPTYLKVHPFLSPAS